MFSCGKHKFSTDKIDDWNTHIETEEHTTSGSAPCKLCGFETKFEFTGKKKADAVPAICKDCRGKL